DNLPAGNYTVTITPPSGYTLTTPNPKSTTTTISNPTDLTLDFGLRPSGSIGDFVWNDLNGNGLQDVGEPGIPGVTVTLSNGASTTTDATGHYGFANLPAATYTVTVGTPSGYTPTTSNVGPDRNVDSNGSGTSVTVSGGTDNS